MALIQIEKINSARKTPLTQGEIADRVGCGRSYLYKVRTGDNGQTLPVLKKIADALECYPSELLPDDWQKPVDVDDDFIDSVVELIRLALISAEQDDADYTPEQVAAMVGIMLKVKARR